MSITQTAAGAPRLAVTYVRKITSQLAYLRPVTDPVQIMRIAGRAREGWEEISSLGRYVKWTGRFSALCRRQSDSSDRVGKLLVRADSYHLILPGAASDWLATYHQTQQREVNRGDPTETRTGLYYHPVEGLDEVEFVIDLLLVPPKAGKPSQTGYEFQLSILRAESRHDPMAALQGAMDGLPEFSAGKDADQAALPLAGADLGDKHQPQSDAA